MIGLRSFTKDDFSKLIVRITDAEMLLQFAGPQFTFPLTEEQLEKNCAEKNRLCFCVTEDENDIGHAEIVITPTSALIGRIFIAANNRGKGVGEQVMNLLLCITFNDLHQQLAELYVFDWNVAAIKCYTKVGFTSNYNKTLVRKIKDKTWIAFNMTITKQEHLNRIASTNITTL